MAWTSTTHSLVCERSGTEHTISVGLPVRHASMDDMPLIVCLDAPWTFGTVLDATRIMSMSGEAPEAVVVGVGFAEDSMRHSFSGLFGVRALLSEPGMFDKWLLASPSIWWDSRAILELEQHHAASNDDLVADVFVSGGEHERESGFSIVDDAIGLVETLNSRGYSGLRASATVLAGDGHSNCIGNAVSKGLRSLSVSGD